jgi:hypothetical protein
MFRTSDNASNGDGERAEAGEGESLEGEQSPWKDNVHGASPQGWTRWTGLSDTSNAPKS